MISVYYDRIDSSSQLLTDSFIRRLLSSIVAVPESAWIFCRGPHGKPQIIYPPQYAHLHFNVSHTRSLIMGVVSSESAVGIDIEWANRPVNAAALSSRFFSNHDDVIYWASPA